MILQTSLAAALLAAPSSSVPQDELLNLLPLGSPLVASVGDLAGLLEGADPSFRQPSWVAFLTDERLRSGLLQLAELDSDLDIELLDEVMDVLDCVHGGAIAITDLDIGAGVAALRVSDGFVPAMREMIGGFGMELTETEILGQPGYRVATSDVDGLSIVEVSGLVLVGIGMNDIVEDDLGAVISTLEEGLGEKRWWTTTSAPRVSNPLFEVFLSLDVIAAEEAEFAEMFPDAGTGYLGVGVGPGNEGDLSFMMDLGENELFTMLAPAFGEADVDLMKLAPKGAVAASVINVDFNALIDAGLTLSGDPSVRQQYEDGIMAGSATLGVDLEEEIFGNLSGDILMVQWPIDAAGLESEDPAAMMAAAPTIVVRIDDSEPFYTLLEAAEGLLGPNGVETSEAASGTLWTTKVMPELAVAFGLSDSMLFLGSEEHVEELMDRSVTGPDSGLLGEAQLAFAREMLNGAYVAASDMELSWDMALSALQLEDDFPQEMLETFEIASEYLRGFGFGSASFTATELGFRMLTR